MPERLRWAVSLLDVQPTDQILEIGCGTGVAVLLIAERLDGGLVTAIDRSAKAIVAARRQNAEHISAGRALLLHADLGDLGDLGDRLDQRYDKIFAVNVNVFWARSAIIELQVIKQLMHRDGTLRLYYETPPGTDASRIAHSVEVVLADEGFTTTTTARSPSLICVTAELP